MNNKKFECAVLRTLREVGGLKKFHGENMVKILKRELGDEYGDHRYTPVFLAGCGNTHNETSVMEYRGKKYEVEIQELHGEDGYMPNSYSCRVDDWVR